MYYNKNMKKFFILLLLICLFGCAAPYEISEGLDEVFASDEELLDFRQNNKTPYYNFYLPSDMYEMDGENNNTVLGYNDSRIIVNINVSSIVNSKYYQDYVLKDEGFFDENKLVYYHEGNYINTKQESIKYFFKVYEYNKQYLLHMNSQMVNVYAYSKQADVKQTTAKILLISKCLEVNVENVMANYSTKDVIDYQKKQINLFDLILPVDGKLEEIFIGE